MKRSSQTLLAAMLGAAVASTTSVSAFADERYSAIVIDARTNEILHADAPDAERFPASLTKMMTLYLLFDAMQRGEISLDSQLTASRHAAAQPPSRLGLRRGDHLTVDQAIRALCVQSANDVAVMIGERLGGSETRFAALMTARAREIGMTDTHFVNANGLPDPSQHTTARDMATLSQALWRDFPQYYHYFQTPSMAWRNHSGRNHNRLLGQVEGVDGIKTGYTRASGYNLASSAERDGRRVIAVVMGGSTAAARDAQVAYLLEGAFEEYARRQALPPGQASFVSLPVQRVDATIAPNGTVITQTAQSFGPEGAPLRGALGPAPITTAPSAASADAQGDSDEAVGATGAQ